MRYDEHPNEAFGAQEPAAQYRLANEGISKSYFLDFVTRSGFNLSEFAALLPVTKRTIEKVKEDELLSPQVSDRVLQIISLYEMGSIVLGSSETFKHWLRTPLLALGDKRPADFLNNDTGISLIKDLLGRIEHGVYS